MAASGGSNSGNGGRDGNDNDDEGRGRISRVPKDLKGLLTMSVAASSPGNTSQNTGCESMSEENKQWLNNALDGMSENPAQRMNQCIARLQNVPGENEEDAFDRKIQALEELIEWCENLDFAMDYHKIGGYDLFPKLLEDEEPEIRWQTLELIATLVQNNPYCQEAGLKHGLIPTLLCLLDTDSNSTVRVKALYALSCLTRDAPEAQQFFIENDGFSVLMRAMQCDVEKLKIKAAFMISHLCRAEPKFKDTFCDMGMIDQLVGHLNEEHSAFHEHLMAALLSIVRDHPRCIEECTRTELGLHEVLQQRISFLRGKEAFEEEKEYASELLKIMDQVRSSSPDLQEVQR